MTMDNSFQTPQNLSWTAHYFSWSKSGCRSKTGDCNGLKARRINFTAKCKCRPEQVLFKTQKSWKQERIFCTFFAVVHMECIIKVFLLLHWVSLNEPQGTTLVLPWLSVNQTFVGCLTEFTLTVIWRNLRWWLFDEIYVDGYVTEFTLTVMWRNLRWQLFDKFYVDSYLTEITLISLWWFCEDCCGQEPLHHFLFICLFSDNRFTRQ